MKQQRNSLESRSSGPKRHGKKHTLKSGSKSFLLNFVFHVFNCYIRSLHPHSNSYIYPVTQWIPTTQGAWDTSGKITSTKKKILRPRIEKSRIFQTKNSVEWSGVEGTLYLYGSDLGTANALIQMIYYPTATDPIQAQIFSLVKNWNGMYNELNPGEWPETEGDQIFASSNIRLDFIFMFHKKVQYKAKFCYTQLTSLFKSNVQLADLVLAQVYYYTNYIFNFFLFIPLHIFTWFD